MGSSRPSRLLLTGYAAIGMMLLVFSVWSAVVPLADSLIAPGTVSVTAQRRSIAHVEGGKVSRLNVSEGDYIDIGQTLLQLDDKDLRSQMNILEYQRLGQTAKLTRLTAERREESAFSFEPSLMTEAQKNPHLQKLLESEIGSFEARLQALTTQSTLYDERINQGNEQLGRLRLQLGSLDRQQAIVEQQLQDAKMLLAKGFGTKRQSATLLLDNERLITERLKIEAEINSVEGVTEDARLNKEGLLAKRSDEIETEISNTQRSLAELDVRIRAIHSRLEGLSIASPVRGVVIDMKITSINDVIKPASPILDILPIDSAYLVEAHIPPEQIEGIVEGMEVEVRFQSLSDKRVPKITGTVAMVSADIISDLNQQHHQYYRAHIALADWRNVEKQIGIVSGMPAEVIFKKRDRTLFNYLFAPLADHIARSAV